MRRGSRAIPFVFAALVVGLGPAACATHVLNANLTRAKLDARIGENFQRGMTYEDVNAKLTELQVSPGVRRTYAPVPPLTAIVPL